MAVAVAQSELCCGGRACGSRVARGALSAGRRMGQRQHPANSVVLANQHSGSLRWYGKRQTLRWDFIAPDRLATTVRELRITGATVYVALEGDEVEMFDSAVRGRDRPTAGRSRRPRQKRHFRPDYLPHFTDPKLPALRCRSCGSSVQVIQRQVRHRAHADRQRRLVREEQRRVVLRRLRCGPGRCGVTPRKKNSPGTFCWKNEKSSAVPVSGPTRTLSAPATRRSVGAIRSVSAGSLRVTG